MTSHRLSRRIDDVLRLQPDAPALEYDHQWLSWGQLRDLAEQISSLIGTDRPQVGILLRNRPAHVAALLARLAAGDDFSTAARIANVAASLAIERPGPATSPTAQELQAALSKV